MKLAIIGAGPAGIFAGKFLKDWDGEIHLFEANKEIGKKLALTGGGRMNLTNKDLNVSHFFSDNERALKHIFKSNFARNYLDLFDDLGIKMKWEGNRALLESQDAAGQVRAWENEFKNQKNLTLHLGHEVRKISRKESGFVIDDKDFDFVLITSGGMLQLMKKNNEQKVYSLAASLAHKIVKPSACLSPIIIPSSPFKDLAGTAMEIELSQNNKNKVRDNLLFTHKGISGPAVLDFSANWDQEVFEINFMPEVKEEDFVNEFQELRNGKNKLLKLLQKYLPKKVALFQAEKIKADEKMIADVSKDDLKLLRKNLFRWRVEGGQTCGYEQSWTTRGGVDLGEIKTSTMESKIVPGLFFGGEILDVAGLCGGYNITWAAISARMACEEILNKNIIH